MVMQKLMWKGEFQTCEEKQQKNQENGRRNNHPVPSSIAGGGELEKKVSHRHGRIMLCVYI